MINFNALTIAGEMVNDTEVVIAKSGSRYGKFVMKSPLKKEAISINVITFGIMVDRCKDFKTGDSVVVVGRIDGMQRGEGLVISLIANDVQSLSLSNQDEELGQSVPSGDVPV